MAKPTVLPKWADLNVVDPTSGQPNVATPPAGDQDEGYKFKIYPPRQFANWLGRHTYLWLKWLDENYGDILIQDIEAKIDPAHVVGGGLVQFTLRVIKNTKTKIVKLIFLDPVSFNKDHSVGLLYIVPVTPPWPDIIIPETAGSAIICSLLIRYGKYNSFVTDEIEYGSLIFIDGFINTTPINLGCPIANNDLRIRKNEWTEPVDRQALIYKQVLTYNSAIIL